MHTTTTPPSTLFAKIWNSHTVPVGDAAQTLLYIDRHYLSDDLPPAAYETLERRAIPIRRPGATVAMPDHYVPTRGGTLADVVDDKRRDMVSGLARQSHASGILHFGIGDPRQGIVHVTGPEQGLSLPGMTVVCGDKLQPYLSTASLNQNSTASSSFGQVVTRRPLSSGRR